MDSAAKVHDSAAAGFCSSNSTDERSVDDITMNEGVRGVAGEGVQVGPDCRRR